MSGYKDNCEGLQQAKTQVALLEQRSDDLVGQIKSLNNNVGKIDKSLINTNASILRGNEIMSDFINFHKESSEKHEKRIQGIEESLGRTNKKVDRVMWVGAGGISVATMLSGGWAKAWAILSKIF